MQEERETKKETAEIPIEEIWGKKKKILVILAHPDDPEFFCGGTIAKWTAAGNEVIYCLLTKGDKGIQEGFNFRGDIKDLRIKEQKEASVELGVNEIVFLEYKDGYLVPNLEMRKRITYIIRKIQPEIVVTCDPTNYFIRDDYINHPDHRAVGQATIDAVFPASQNARIFPDLLEQEELHPHHVQEVWLSLPYQPNLTVNVTDTWDKKIAALLNHQSQIGDPEVFIERMKSSHTEDTDASNPRYEEHFRRIILRKK